MSNSSLNSDYGKTWGPISTTTKTTTPATTSSNPSASSSSSTSSSSSSGGGGGGSSTPTGYAAAYLTAIRSGANDAQANTYATHVMGGSGLTQNDINRITGGGGSFSGSYSPTTGYALNGYEGLLQQELQKMMPQVPQQPQQPIYDLEKIMAMMPQMPATPPVLSFNEAKTRAENQLNPLFKETLDKTMEAVDENNIRRGFFGQLPGAALSRSTAADIETKKLQSIGQLANQMVGQSEAGARSQQALAQQQWSNQSNALLDALRTVSMQENSRQANLLNQYNALLGTRRLEQDERKQELMERLGWLPWLLAGN